ncbi:hypothetical protein TWF281_004625 [Arthrobotrys megalospora]
MTFSAPQYIPGETDLVLLIGPEEIRFEANHNILASQSKFFEAACRENFKEGNERVIKLPEVQFEPMIKVLAWLYRADPEVPDDFMGDEPTSTILNILDVADFLYIDDLVKDYSRSVERKLQAWDPSVTQIEAAEFGNCVKVMNKIYQARGSIKRRELLNFFRKLKSSSRNISWLMDAASKVAEPNGKFYQNLSYVVMKSCI